jgi:hypothetical protein
VTWRRHRKGSVSKYFIDGGVPQKIYFFEGVGYAAGVAAHPDGRAGTRHRAAPEKHVMALGTKKGRQGGPDGP